MARLFRKKQYPEMLKGSHSVPLAAIPIRDAASHTPPPHGEQRRQLGYAPLKLGFFVSPFFALKEENFRDKIKVPDETWNNKCPEPSGGKRRDDS